VPPVRTIVLDRAPVPAPGRRASETRLRTSLARRPARSACGSTRSRSITDQSRPSSRSPCRSHQGEGAGRLIGPLRAGGKTDAAAGPLKPPHRADGRARRGAVASCSNGEGHPRAGRNTKLRARGRDGLPAGPTPSRCRSSTTLAFGLRENSPRKRPRPPRARTGRWIEALESGALGSTERGQGQPRRLPPLAGCPGRTAAASVHREGDRAAPRRCCLMDEPCSALGTRSRRQRSRS